MPRPKKPKPPRTRDSKKQPVTVGKLPVVKCELCKRKMAFRPDKTTGQKVLNDHYKQVHGIG
jgi:hypothetical protein